MVKVFDGQPPAKGDFALGCAARQRGLCGDGSIGNALKLSDEQTANVQGGAKDNGLEPSATLAESRSDNGKEVFCPLNFTIEMETGTGKTYSFIKTMYELNKVYGFKKFVVVVPSVAIREGTHGRTCRSPAATLQRTMPMYPACADFVRQYQADRLAPLCAERCAERAGHQH